MERATSSSSSSSAATFFFRTLIFITLIIFLTEVAGAQPKYCIGPLVTDAAYPRYVNNVLAKLATDAPTKRPYMEAVARYPDDAPGSAVGTTSCSATTDASRCASCLQGLRKLLVDSCSHYEGGGATGGMICKMAFGIVH